MILAMRHPRRYVLAGCLSALIVMTILSATIGWAAPNLTVVLKVAMSCEGCSGAVKRVLSKMEGVESFDIDTKEQKVTVKGNVQPEAVLQTVSKTGKKSAFWENEAQSTPPKKRILL